MLDQAQSAQHHAVTFELRLDVLLQYSLGSLVLALSRTENCGRRCFETPVTHSASFEIAFHGIRAMERALADGSTISASRIRSDTAGALRLIKRMCRQERDGSAHEEGLNAWFKRRDEKNGS
jgi:hypothetical protein